MQSRSRQAISRLVIVFVVVVLVSSAGLFVLIFRPVGAPTPAPTIQVASIWLDRTDAPAGSAYYLLTLNISNTGSAVWGFDPGFLQVVSNSSQSYAASGLYNATAVMGEQSIPAGSSRVGIVAFQLPAGEGPTRLAYNDQTRGVSLNVGNLPPVSATASRFNYNVRLTVNGGAVAADGWTVVNGSDPWVRSIIANGVILNNSLTFFTGQTVQVNLWFEYLRKPADPGSIKLVSASNDDKFIVVNESSLPITMSGWASQAGVTFLLRDPPGQHIGNLNFSVRFSS
jgi:hypothetical protein